MTTSLDRRLPTLLAATAALLAAWSLVPFAVWWNDADPAYFGGAWQTWGWGSVVAALAVVLALAVTRGRAPALMLGLWRRLLGVPTGLFVAVAAAVFALLTLLCTLLVFDGNPRNVDGFAQLFQARIFHAGHLSMPAPEPLSSFATLQMILVDGWMSQYPPGQSVVLAAGLKLGAWWVLNPLIAAAFAVATHRVARWCADESAARLTMILLCLSPFAVAVAGSEMSHLPAATLGMGAAAFAVTAADRGRIGSALLAGLLLGLQTSFRPLDAVAAAIPVGAVLVIWSARRLPALAATAAGGIAGSLPVLWFNAQTTGSPTLFGYVKLWGPEHSLGFHPTPWGTPLTLTRAIGQSGMDLHQLNTYMLDGTVPVLLIIASGFLVGRSQLGRKDLLPLLGVLSLILLLFFYFHRDVFYGPRFLYGVVGWFTILVARALVLLRRRSAADTGFGPAAAFATLATIVLGLVTITPGRVEAYRRTTPIFSLHPSRDARAAGITNAVVVIPDGWGSRLIARMWELGIPVRRSGRLYAAIDACTLEGHLGAAERTPALRDALLFELEALAALRRPGVRAGVTADPNLRLPAPATELDPACATEIEVDRRGYYSFAPYLWLNDATLDGDIVWARDMGPRNAALFARHAGRRFYRYAPGTDGKPMFIPVAGAGW